MTIDQARDFPVQTLLSGPAGGVVGAFKVAQAAGFDRIITLDMGGTSTDVSLCDGRFNAHLRAASAAIRSACPSWTSTRLAQAAALLPLWTRAAR